MKLSATVLASAIAAMPASAAELKAFTHSPHDLSVQAVDLPGTDYTVMPGTLRTSLDSDSFGELQEAIAAWLSFEFGLPSVEEMPAVHLAPKHEMLRLRYRDAPSNRRGGSPDAKSLVQPLGDIVAIYDDMGKAIYLPDGWSGNSPAELSILVHEMVHHIQNLAGVRFACPEAREEEAFAAQERWLRLFGRDLLTDFDLDPLTLFVRTKCF